jgi:hypothetical protein
MAVRLTTVTMTIYPESADGDPMAVRHQTTTVDGLRIFYREAGMVAGAVAHGEDVATAEVHLLDAGHFALDEAARQIADLIRGFFDRRRW